MRRIIESDSRFIDSQIDEADDGVTAINAVHDYAAQGTQFDFILMDFTMVTYFSLLLQYRATNIRRVVDR